MVRLGKLKVNYFILGCTILVLSACAGSSNNKTESQASVSPLALKKNNPTPLFNADSCFAFVKAQVDFGPRVPGTKAHLRCANYLEEKLKTFHFEVKEQHGTVQTFDGKQFDLKNIIGSFNLSAKSRIMVSSHWDSRPFADEDEVQKDSPIDAAIDGASGVGVALEIARNLAIQNPSVGVDIVFFDIEDYGDNGSMDSWCLGSHYWSQNLPPSGYTPKYGVLLDMVGAKGATFPKESNSVEFAPQVVDRLWDIANAQGYGNIFLNETISFVGIDDHIWVNRAGIPCVDIIHYDKQERGFGPYHHTHKDNMTLLDKVILKAVGQTLLEAIYTEK